MREFFRGDGVAEAGFCVAFLEDLEEEGVDVVWGG